MPLLITALIPAAGHSRRMGRPKLLLPFRGGTVLGGVVRALREGGAGRLLAVLAPGDDALAAWCRRAGVEVAVNPAPERGMLSTVQEGVAALGGAAALAASGEAVLVCPGDLPALTPGTVARLIAAVVEEGAPLAVPVHGGRHGHPLALSPGVLAEIAGLDPAVGLRQLLDRHALDRREIPVDDRGAVTDVDTPEEYRALADEDTEPGDPRER